MNYVYVNSLDLPPTFENVRKSFPTSARANNWRYIAEEYPNHRIADVHVTDTSVHIYLIKKENE
jgi:hypothetical protein